MLAISFICQGITWNDVHGMENILGKTMRDGAELSHYKRKARSWHYNLRQCRTNDNIHYICSVQSRVRVARGHAFILNFKLKSKSPSIILSLPPKALAQYIIDTIHFHNI